MVTDLVKNHFFSFIGKDLPLKVIVNSFLAVLVLFFYFFSLASTLKPQIWVFIDRVTYSTIFENRYVINSNTDTLIISFVIIACLLLSLHRKIKFIVPPIIYFGFTLLMILANQYILLKLANLIIIPLLFSFIIYDRFRLKKVFINIDTNTIKNYLTVLIIVLSIIGFVFFISKFLNWDLDLPIQNYAYFIFVLLAVLTPPLLFSISIGFPLKIFIRYYREKRNKSFKVSYFLPYQSINNKNKLIYLFFIILLSIIMGLIPHLQTIYNNDEPIGSDSMAYVKVLNNLMKAEDIQHLLIESFIVQFSGDRAVSLLFFYMIINIFNMQNTLVIIEFLPIILGPVLILSTYFLTREITSNESTALLSSFITAVSFPVLAGIYGGLYSNWFSLIFGYTSLTFLLKYLKKPTKFSFIFYSIAIILLLFSHAVSWTIFITVIIIFLLFMLKLYPYKKKHIFFLLVISFLTVGIDISKEIVVGSSGFSRDIAFANQQESGLNQLTKIWSNSIGTTQIYLGGLLGNFLVYALVIYWIYKSNLTKPGDLLLLIFLSIVIVPLLIGGVEIQGRVLYEIPIQIPVSIALSWLIIQKNKIFTASICLWLLFISLRAVSNLHLIKQ